MYHGSLWCPIGCVRNGIASRSLFRLAQAGHGHIKNLLGFIPGHDLIFRGQLVQGNELVPAGDVRGLDLRQLQDYGVVVLQVRGKGCCVKGDLRGKIALLRMSNLRMMRMMTLVVLCWISLVVMLVWWQTGMVVVLFGALIVMTGFLS